MAQQAAEKWGKSKEFKQATQGGSRRNCIKDAGFGIIAGGAMGGMVGLAERGMKAFPGAATAGATPLPTFAMAAQSKALYCAGFFGGYQSVLCGLRWAEVNKGKPDYYNSLIAGVAAMAPYVVLRKRAHLSTMAILVLADNVTLHDILG